ncbi:serine/threonine protein kinase [Pseudomarimonas arenosa]|uniref:Protein kinase n=1 Tax=Pseudomarimonas arenosa TaxID=2774145 RepID=A0AAW3ZNC7_9GAMM|nr:serine/threonine-protein kinase [Pseudomarimonas arenosa]MBD8526139.1 protein kinase [Pseudomarimonas arenosa]
MSAPAFDIPGYELIRELGSGGMATVFLATQRSLDRKVAIKVMRRGLADENVEKRFLIEGRTMARLPHPNIVGVYDIVQNESINYIAMEFLEGGSLSDRMREGLSLADAIAVVVQIAGALQYAHDNGIIHRDLKPANIMFRDGVTPVLTDFGIARQQNSEATRLTQTGMMIGTPTYMSPEQATGSDLDGRSDQYSLGVMFYEMLTGRAPFEGSTPIQVVLAHINSPPPPLPPQFSFFQPLLDRMLSKERDQRFPDLKVFVRQLKDLVTGSDALVHQLQFDPTSSSSEQLRALGFSESQIHTGAGPQAPAQAAFARVSSQSAAPRVSGSGPGVRLPPAKKKLPWWIPAAVAAIVAAAGLGGWLMFSGGGGLDPAIERVVSRNLAEVDRLIAAGKLVAPPGDNALELLQEANDLALREVSVYPEAEKRFQQIAGQLRQQAEQALQKQSFEVAKQRLSEAYRVLPDAAENKKLEQAIMAAELAVERQAKVKSLIARAGEAERAGRLAGEGQDNALAILRDALQIDPDSGVAKQAMADLVGKILQPVERSVAAGQLDRAESALQSSASFLAAEPAWQALEQKIQKARQIQAERARIDQLVAAARQQLAAGRVVEPAGNNVVETLQRISEIDPDNSEAGKVRAEAARLLVRAASEAERGGDFSLALTRYDQALQLQPGDSSSQNARKALEQRVGERAAQISRDLTAARDAIAKLHYFSPADSNAHALLQGVIKRQPDEPAAVRLLQDLPRLVRESAEALAARGNLEQAVALLGEAQAVYKNDAEIAALARKLAGQQQQSERLAKRQALLDAVQRALAKRILNADTAREIGFAIAELQKLDPNDIDARRYRDQFLGGVIRVLDASNKLEELDAMEPVIAQIKAQLGDRSEDVRLVVSELAQRRAALTAAEQERLAAMSGVLVLNATPWATVESVVEASSGQSIDLPSERSTPLRLSLPKGSYRVTYKHPLVGRSVVQVVQVDAKATQLSQANFGALTATDYLKRAGYGD